MSRSEASGGLWPSRAAAFCAVAMSMAACSSSELPTNHSQGAWRAVPSHSGDRIDVLTPSFDPMREPDPPAKPTHSTLPEKGGRGSGHPAHAEPAPALTPAAATSASPSEKGGGR